MLIGFLNWWFSFFTSWVKVFLSLFVIKVCFKEENFLCSNLRQVERLEGMQYSTRWKLLSLIEQMSYLPHLCAHKCLLILEFNKFTNFIYRRDNETTLMAIYLDAVCIMSRRWQKLGRLGWFENVSDFSKSRKEKVGKQIKRMTERERDRNKSNTIFQNYFTMSL